MQTSCTKRALLAALCGLLAACDLDRSEKHGRPDGGGNGKSEEDAAQVVDAFCPNLEDVPRPQCVESTTVDPGRTELAKVMVTASTNSDEYTFTLYDDGSAEGAVSWRSLSGAFSQEACSLPAHTPLVVACLDWLAQAGDITEIPTSEWCGKSLSFGTATLIIYRSKMSVDFQCLDTHRYTCRNFSLCTSLLGVPREVIGRSQSPDGGDDLVW